MSTRNRAEMAAKEHAAVNIIMGVGCSSCDIMVETAVKERAKKLQIPNEVAANSTGNSESCPIKTALKAAETPNLANMIKHGNMKDSWCCSPYISMTMPPKALSKLKYSSICLSPSLA